MDQFWVMGVLAGVGSRINRREGLLGTNILGSTHRLPNGWGDARATPSVIRGGQPDIWVFVTKVSLHLCRQATFRMHIKFLSDMWRTSAIKT